MDTISLLRSYRFLGVAIFDTVTSYITFNQIGKMIGVNPVFMGLSSIPISLVVHHISNVSTPLLEFVKSNLSSHVMHAVIIGAVAGGISKGVGMDSWDAVNIGYAMTIFSVLYMKEHGHNLPKWVRKKMIRYYLKYKRMTS